MRNLFFILVLISNGLAAQLTADQCMQKGNERVKLKDYDAAMKYYQFGINQDPEKMEIYNNMGNIYLHFSSYEEAVKYYDKALRLDASNYAAFQNRGYCLYQLKKYEKAEKDFQRALALDSTSYSCYGLSLAGYALNKYDDALKAVDIAIELNPNDVNCYLLRAKILDKTIDNRELIMAEYDKALSLAPDMPRIYEERALMWEAWGDAKLAKYDQKTAKGLHKIQSEGELYTSEFMIVYL